MSRNDTTITKSTEVVIHSTRPAVLEAVADFAATIEKALESDEAFIRELIDAQAERTAAHMKQLSANADLRARFMREVPLLPATDIARSWKAHRRVFSVAWGDVEQFPLFQFAMGEPIAAMRDLLTFFSGLSEWQIALWFFAPNAWLENAPPMDVLQRDPEAVIAAARHAVEPIEG